MWRWLARLLALLFGIRHTVTCKRTTAMHITITKQ